MTLHSHSELTKHKRLSDRKRCRSAVLDKFLQCRRRVDKTIVIVTGIIVHLAVIDRRNRMVGQPLAPLRRGAITPRSGRDHVVWIERLQVSTHLRKPRTPLSPTPCNRLRFIDQLPTEDRGIISINNAGNRISPRRKFFQVFAIQASSLGV